MRRVFLSPSLAPQQTDMPHPELHWGFRRRSSHHLQHPETRSRGRVLVRPASSHLTWCDIHNQRWVSSTQSTEVLTADAGGTDAANTSTRVLLVQEQIRGRQMPALPFPAWHQALATHQLRCSCQCFSSPLLMRSKAEKLRRPPT